MSAYISQQLWIPIAAIAAFLGAISGALITGYYNLRVKQNEYVNEYYKIVLKRRVETYEQVENLVRGMTACVIDKDNRPYHLMFSRDEDWADLYKLLFLVMSKRLWLSNELFSNVKDFNLFIFPASNNALGLVEFGKQNYKRLAELRDIIESQHIEDMLHMYDVKKFMKLRRKF